MLGSRDGSQHASCDQQYRLDDASDPTNVNHCYKSYEFQHGSLLFVNLASSIAPKCPFVNQLFLFLT